MKYLRIDEIDRRFGLTRAVLEALASEGLIEIKRTLDEEPVLSIDDVEKARVAHLLMEELDVNFAGAEVIVRMRSEMIAMQRQFGQILEALIAEIRQAASSR